MNARYLLVLTVSLLTLTAAHAAAPYNDTVLKAIQFKSPFQVITTPDVSSATAAMTDPMINGVSAGKTVWYKIFNPPAPSYQPKFALSVKSVTGVGSVGIYGGDPDNPLSGLSQFNVASFTAGQTFTFPDTAAPSTYFIMVAGSGVFELTYRFLPPLYPNDYPVKAQTITDFGTVQGTNHLSTVSADEPTLPTPVANTVWYKWTPTFTGTAVADTNFSFVGDDVGSSPFLQMVHDTVLAAYSGTPGSLTLLAWDDDSGWDVNSRVSFPVVAGITYHLGVSTKGGKVFGKFELNSYPGSSAGEFNFAPGATSSAAESITPRPVKVRRRFAGTGTATVQLASIAGGTATSAVDYQAVNATLNFAAPGPNDAAWEVSSNVTIIDDVVSEPAETIKLQLSSPSGSATLGGTFAATLTIDDNETVDYTSYRPFQLDQPVVRFAEGAGNVIMNVVTRTYPTGYSLGFVQSAVGGTAERENEFWLYGATMDASQQRAFLTGQIYDDDVFELDEQIQIEVNLPDYPTPQDRTYTIIITDDDPYLPVAGRLVAPLDYASRRAQLFVTVNASGLLTGKLQIVGESLPIKTQLDWRGKAVIFFAPKGRASGLVLTLQATDATGGFTVKLLDGLTGNASTVNAVLQNYSKTDNPCPEAGYYTFASEGIQNAHCLHAGSVTVDAAGNAMVAGRLLDGTSYTMAGYVDGDGLMGAMTSLYSNQGTLGLRSSLPLSNNQAGNFTFVLVRPGRTGDPIKLGFLRVPYFGTICRYTPPAPNQQALEAWFGGTGNAKLELGPLGATVLNKALTISTSNVIGAPADAVKLKLTVTPKTGIFTGSFVLPNTTKTLSIYGALIDLPTMNGYGQGFFFDGLKGGKITIGKP